MMSDFFSIFYILLSFFYVWHLGYLVGEFVNFQHSAGAHGA